MQGSSHSQREQRAREKVRERERERARKRDVTDLCCAAPSVCSVARLQTREERVGVHWRRFGAGSFSLQSGTSSVAWATTLGDLGEWLLGSWLLGLLLPPPLFGGDESSHSLVKIPCIRSPASLYDLFLPLFLTMTVTVTMRQPENRAAESTAVSVSGPQVPAPAPFRRPRERGSPARDATNNEGPVRLPGLPSLPGLPAFQSGGVGLGVAGTRLPAVGELTASLPPPASASSAAAHHPHGHPHAGVQGPTPLTLHPPPLLPPLSQQHQLPQNHHQHQHHPSSSITNTGARTPDSLHADPAFLSSALPEGKSRTLQGPSAKDWARHRETIIELYRQYPLKKVSELMRKHHGFSAR